jgi:hypothetical protein
MRSKSMTFPTPHRVIRDMVYFLLRLFKTSFVDGKYIDRSIDGRAGRKANKNFFDKSFSKMCSIYAIIKEVSEKICFLALFLASISNFVWTGFIQESSHVWSKKVKLLVRKQCKLLIILHNLVF